MYVVNDVITWLLCFRELLYELLFVLVLVDLQLVDILQLRLRLHLTQYVFDTFVGWL